MFEALIESLLGDWGTEVLDFVLKYQLYFSIAVVAFGIVLLVRKRRKAKGEENNERT